MVTRAPPPDVFPLAVTQAAFDADTRGIFKRFGYWLAVNGLSPRVGDLRRQATQAATPAPPHARIIFDTIGQTIPRTIGHCRLRGFPIWAEGINEAADETTATTQSFALALCSPIDPNEEGEFFSIWSGDTLVQNEGSSVAPVGWSDAEAQALAAALDNIVVFPGDEAQQPASAIVADRGASVTNAFRRIRYVLIPNYPILAGGGSGGLPNLSFGHKRTNDGEEPDDDTAAEFFSGET